MQEIVLKLSVDKASKILQCLAKQPYEDVAELISDIQTQANAQLSDAQVESSVEAE